ncbi:phage tail spike protein [Terrihalobacillus insolitus]|uniref:phage tail spike protein n=1 Tax=Terrihalobacillus insolitus TaxID=2950438 RepID=UPI00233FA4E8|nr:phage tail spike protein [Terrihalobacillus insolitus]MDC3414262.1 phage tail protein [Terrihalobacillus insolitus]
MRQSLFLFDSNDNLLTTTKNYIKAPFEETVNEAVSFEFTIPADNEDAQHVIGGNQVAFRDLENRFRLFVIREVEDEDGAELLKRAICLPAIDELNDEPIEDLRPQNQTATYVVGQVLANTRWLTGNVANLGNNSANFYYISVLKSLKKIVSIWGGELVDRITIDDTGIAGRYVDIVYRRGADTGKVLRVGKDVVNIRRTVLYYPKTALYGRGSAVESGNGYSRKITFADVSWSTANGDPVDKPLGQEWVGDPDALNTHGVLQSDGTLRHRYGFFEDSNEKDPATLLQKTWDVLQEEKDPKVNYEMSIITFEGVAGYEHELVRLGDTGAAIDQNIKPEILIETRVMRMKYDIGDPTDGDVTLGNFFELYADDKKLDQLVERVNDGAIPVVDGSFPDVIPPVPTGVSATGLYKTIMLDWDYDSASYIAAYEVYASQVTGFVPDSTNLVFRGKTGGFNFDAAINQQWYFKLRAVNTQGTASAFTAEYSAQTVRIPADTDIEPYTITKTLLAQTALIDTVHIGNAVVTNAKIANLAVDNEKIKDGTITNVKIADATIKSAKIVSLDANKINATNLSAISADLGTVTAGTLKAVTLEGATGSFSGRLTSKNLYIEPEDQSPSTVNLNLFRVSFNPDKFAGYFTFEQVFQNAETLELSLRNTSGQYLSGSAVLSVDGSIKANSVTANRIDSSGTATIDGKLYAKGDIQVKTIWSEYATGRDMLNDFNNGNVSVNAVGGALYLGYSNTSKVQLQVNTSIQGYGELVGESGYTRFRGIEGSHDASIIINRSDQVIGFYQNGNYRHRFFTDGSKAGGSIEVDGINLGMSPIDSPQILLEYIEFDVPLSTDGTKIYLDATWLKTVENFAVFPNNGTIIEKGIDYVIISGEGNADIRFIGERKGYADVFYGDMGGTA